MPSQLVHALSSSVGSKILIALTGLGLAVFLVTHLAGNILFLFGPETFNTYSHTLLSNPLVYVAEAGLLVIFLLHVVKTLVLFFGAQQARPQGYHARRWAKTKSPRSRKSVASTTMIVTGLFTLLFLVTHLGTFKFGTYYESATGMRDLYRLQLEIFSHPGYVAFYMIAMALIFLHLWHGLTSAAQSLGVDHPQWTPRILAAGRVLAVVLAGGFFLLPLYTFLLARAS
ncbi:MAG: succinate dehydrogenase cytochrome b subunit [Vicinamibacterales bacterium]|nr:succinate dehydrogenase cytochrome b subunit [Vicinamibacterales bacterium]